MPIKVRHNGLEIDGNLLPLVSGSVHYWRTDHRLWPRVLDQVRDLGFSIVETYLPWAVHETAPGDFDFGKKDPDKNLDAFLGLAEERGLKVLVRPGPHINAELPFFGYPEWIIKDPRFWARDAEGAPILHLSALDAFPIPSYANPALFEAFEPYLAALSPVLLKHLHPRGGVVALQVDNEAGYFFHTGTYQADYSEASLGLYRHYLEMKYRTLKALNAAHGTSLKGFGEVQAPRRNHASNPQELAPYLDWTEYKEYQVSWALSRLAELYRAKGLEGMPLYHNFYGSFRTPFNLPDMEKDSGIDFCGLDSYPQDGDAGGVLDQARYLSVSSRLPYIPEYGAGAWPDRVTPDVDDLKSCVLAPFMGGARGVNFYMLAERDRWMGSPIDGRGELRQAFAEPYRQLNRFLRSLEWENSFPQVQALLLHAREAQLVGASFEAPRPNHQLFELPAAFLHEAAAEGFFGGDGVGPSSVARFHQEAGDFLRRSHLPFALGDSGLAPEKLKKAGLAVLACWGYLEESWARRLLAFVEEGGLLVLGPQLPAFNQKWGALEAFKDLSLTPGKPASHGDGKILLMTGTFDPKAAASLLQKARLRPEITLSDDSLDVAVHKLSGKQVLFVRNPHGEERSCTVFKDGKFVLKPLWAGGKFLGAVEEREVTLGPREIKVWELIAC